MFKKNLKYILLIFIVVLALNIGCDPGGRQPSTTPINDNPTGKVITEEEVEKAKSAYTSGDYSGAINYYNALVEKAPANTQQEAEFIVGLAWSKIKKDSNPVLGLNDFTRALANSDDAKVGYAINSAFSMNDSISTDPSTVILSKALTELNKINLDEFTPKFETSTVTTSLLYATRGMLKYLNDMKAEAELDFAKIATSADYYAKQLYDAYNRFNQ